MDQQLTDSQYLARLQEEKTMIMKLNDDKVLKISSNNRMNSEYTVTVNGPCYLYSTDYAEPKLSLGPHNLKLVVPRGYPFDKPRIYFVDENKRLAHVNVFKSGTVCTGVEWHPQSHNLVHVIKKTMQAMTFDPMAIRFDSMADKSYRDWMKKMLLNRKFPTFKWTEPSGATPGSRRIIKL